MKVDSGSNFLAYLLSYVAWLSVGKELSMTILLPDEGRFRDFEDSVDADLVDRILDDIEERNVLLTMPRFEFESKFRLDETLKKIGMPNAFSGDADFSGMTGPGSSLAIQAVIHKAFVSVDEKGTEATAASAVGLNMSGPISVTVDRPFLFLIQDRATRTILFLGRMESPTEGSTASATRLACDAELRPTLGTPATASSPVPTITHTPTPTSSPTPASTPSVRLVRARDTALEYARDVAGDTHIACSIVPAVGFPGWVASFEYGEPVGFMRPGGMGGPINRRPTFNHMFFRVINRDVKYIFLQEPHRFREFPATHDRETCGV